VAYITVGTENSADVDIFYTDQGSGQPVVLIHGFPLNGESWGKQQAALLDAGYRVIAYDRRGFGASTKTASGSDYDTFAADLHALVEELELTDAVLVGFSMGTGEIARYLSRYGADRIAKVAFLGSLEPWLLKTDDNPDGGLAESDVQEMEEGARTDRENFLDGFTTNFFSVDGELKVTDQQRQDAIALEQHARDEALVACIGAFGRTDFRDDLTKVDVPTLVIHGDGDAVVPFEVSGKRTAEAISGSELVVVAGAPHGFNVSHAAEFNAALLDFLQK
jgi:pimeloyl-ACP methyl ester carboxylesterase